MKRKLKQRLMRMMSVTLAFALAMPLLIGLSGQQVVYADPEQSQPFIHQVYGGGGKNATPFTHSFIELYNPTSEDVDLDGWQVEYASSRSGSQHLASTGGEWVSLDLIGTLPAYSSYLIRGAAETTTDSVYEIAPFDQEWNGRYIDNDQYNVRLVHGDTVLDQVTVKEPGKDGVEGTPIEKISKQTSVRRVDFKDTDDNSADFEVLRFEGSSFASQDALNAFIAQYRPRSLADGAWGLAPGGGEEPGEDDTIIKIFHVNDVHSRVNHAISPPANHPQIGYAQFKTFINRESEGADGTLILDAGDTFHGQSFASIERGEGVAELLKAVGFDALAPGNHDFNYGVERLLELETLSEVPLLSANTRLKENGAPLFDQEFLVKVIDGVTIGVFGLTTPETAYKTNPKNVEDIDFGTDEEVIEAAEEAVTKLKEEHHADIVIALTHIGDDPSSTIKSTDIAEQVDGIDLIIDGHSHSNYPTGRVVRRPGHKDVIIASTGEHFKNVGVVTLGYNKDRQEVTAVNAVTKSDAQLPLSAYPEDQAVRTVYDAIIERQAGELSQVVGATPIALNGEREQVRSSETNLGRLITDAMIAESGADVAITNGGGIRASITAGQITKKQVIDTLPFGNFIITKELTGAQIKAAIEQGMTFGAGSFPHVGGMTVTVEKYGTMSGSTPVEKGRVIDIQVNGDPIDMDDTYLVATNDFMGAGGDGYTVLRDSALVNEFNALDEALIDYTQTLEPADFTALDEERRLILSEKDGGLSHLGSFYTGYQSKDGGVAEIVSYNPDNRKMYIVNGNEKKIDIVSLANLENRPGNEFVLEKRIDVSEMIEGFNFGDITSIDVSTRQKLIAVAVQADQYDAAGAVLLLDYNGNLVKHVDVGVQPDMVTFTPDGSYVLTADEGEPRAGYGTGTVDPKGSVTIVDLTEGVEQAEAAIVTFDPFDDLRADLVNDNVILKKGAAPSVDLEPEYVAVASDSKTAYVSLQEANAIATLDIENRAFTSVRGLGFKDHSQPGNELDLYRDRKIEIKNQPVYGVYMPDGLAAVEIGGKTYLLTPNEGDAREWGSYENTTTATLEGNSFDILINDAHDGLGDDEEAMYILGGRSFSIWDAQTLELVFDSGSDFERITAERYPNFFNVSNDNLTMDHRSNKKGPEPEDVKVIEVDGKVFAAIGLERIGGVMMYDITNPREAEFYDYINTRDYSSNIAGDVSPEGLKFVAAEHSPTGYPLLLAAHEVSGTVAVYQVNEGYTEPQPILPFELTVEKQVASGMATYKYAVDAVPAAPTYTGDYYVVFQVYEGSNTRTPGATLIKKATAGAPIQNEELRIGSSKKVKIMVVSAVDGPDSRVLAEAYGVE
ncbi:choice-of-anchor I family protein [Paenibacillus sp. 1P07SE]|uniref:choice-of-anchor I family protein n=1 Tax=Paenibacillus sp. 1P07SE TaxID=3132209 RepID=UPI0039A5DC39